MDGSAGGRRPECSAGCGIAITSAATVTFDGPGRTARCQLPSWIHVAPQHAQDPWDLELRTMVTDVLSQTGHRTNALLLPRARRSLLRAELCAQIGPDNPRNLPCYPAFSTTHADASLSLDPLRRHVRARLGKGDGATERQSLRISRATSPLKRKGIVGSGGGRLPLFPEESPDDVDVGPGPQPLRAVSTNDDLVTGDPHEPERRAVGADVDGDDRHQRLAQRRRGEADVEPRELLAEDLVGVQSPHVRGLAVPHLDAEVRAHHHDAGTHAAEDALQERVHRVEVGGPLAELVVDRLELLVARLELLVHRLEFLVRRLELLVRGLELLVR